MNMKNVKQDIKKGVGDLGDKLKMEKGQGYQALVGSVLQKSTMVKDILGMSDAMVEGIYGQAYRLYNNGKYREAVHLFRMLIMLNSIEPKYLMGLAACFHMLKEYQAAVDTYALCGFLDTGNPLPYFHASDCYLQMKDVPSAVVSLNLAIKRAQGKPEYKILHDRCVITVEGLNKQLEEMYKNRKKG